MTDNKSIGRIVSCIHRHSGIHISKQLEPYNIGRGQLHYLMILNNKDGINQEYLAEELMMDKATSARAIKKLEDEGFITRKRDDNDHRAYEIYITDKGKNMIPEMRKVLKNWSQKLLDGFTEEEKTLLFDFLERIEENATEDH